MQQVIDLVDTKMTFTRLVLLSLIISTVLGLSVNRASAQDTARTAHVGLSRDLRDRYDSLTYINKLISGSPLVIGHRRVICTDTIVDDQNRQRIDTSYQQVVDVLTDKGEVIRTKHPYYQLKISSDNRNGCLILTGDNDCWRDYPYGMRNPYKDLVIDIHDPSIADSGHVRSFRSETDVLEVTRQDSRDINYYRIGRGSVFSWADPMRRSIVFAIRHKTQLVFILADENHRSFWLIDENGKAFTDQIYCHVGDVEGYQIVPRDTIIVGVNDPSGQRRYFPFDLATRQIVYPADRVLQAKKLQWWYCPRSGEQCIDKLQFVSVENMHLFQTINAADVVIELTDENTKDVLYRKKHTVTLNLDPGEVGPSSVFYIDSPLWIDGPISWTAKFVSYR
jgi:hypothetical protein